MVGKEGERVKGKRVRVKRKEGKEERLKGERHKGGREKGVIQGKGVTLIFASCSTMASRLGNSTRRTSILSLYIIITPREPFKQE